MQVADPHGLAESPSYLAALNAAQREAVAHEGVEPLLIIAGAGSGKTNTLAHRVAHLMLRGADPRRILLLTFSRRAATEMSRRAERIIAATRKAASSSLGSAGGSGGLLTRDAVHWAGTFHAIGNRLLRLHAPAIGLDPSFTVLDRSDAADLMNLVRNEQGLAKKSRRFPKKATCTEWSTTRSTGTRGSIIFGFLPMSCTAERMAAKSTSRGTPVKSCKTMRATVKGIS